MEIVKVSKRRCVASDARGKTGVADGENVDDSDDEEEGREGEGEWEEGGSVDPIRNAAWHVCL